MPTYCFDTQDGVPVQKSYRMGEVDVHAFRKTDLDFSEGEFVLLFRPLG